MPPKAAAATRPQGSTFRVIVRKSNGRLELHQGIEALVIREGSLYLNPLPQQQHQTGLIIYRPGAMTMMRIDFQPTEAPASSATRGGGGMSSEEGS